MTAGTTLASRPPSATRWRATLLGAAVFLLTFAAFARLIACDFTWWDDPDTIHQNPLLNPPTMASLGHYWTAIGPSAPMSLYVPATYTVWIGLARIAHVAVPDADHLTLDPHIFHAANVLLHALAAVVLFALLRRLIRRDWPAAIGALLFALHPVQVEAVAWVSGLKDVLCGLLSIAALWQYLEAVGARELAPSPGMPDFGELSRTGEGGGQADFERNAVSDNRNHPHPRRPNRWRWALATILLALAILAKPTAVVVPFMAMAIDRLLLRRRWPAILRSLWPWFVIALAGAAIAQWSQSAPWASPLPIRDRPAIAADAVAFYLGKLVWPAHLCPDYGHRPIAVIADVAIYFTWILPAAIGALLWMLRRRWPIGLAGGWLFVLPLVPVLGLAPFMFQFLSTTADHYLYLAMVGPALVGAWALARCGTRVTVVAIIVMMALATRTLMQEPYWQDTESLFEHTLAVNPKSFTACDLLGLYHSQQYHQLTFEAWQAHRGGAENVATALSQAAQQQLLISLGFYQRGLAIYPQYVPSLVNMAIVNQELGRPEAAKKAIHQVLVLQPQIPEGFRANPIGLATNLIRFGDAKEAIPLLDQILAGDPTNRQAAVLKARALQQLAPVGRASTDPSPG